MKLSVVILNYNVRYFLEQCIRSVERALNGFEAEIMVVDNDSKDDSCEMVQKRFPKIKLIRNADNLGFSKAYNIAIKEAKGEYICILNPDTAVAEDTFRKSLSFAEKHEKLGALGAYLMDGTGHFLPESKRNLPTPKASLKKFLGLTRGTNGYYDKHIQNNEAGEVSILAGAFMLLKKEVYEEVGGFDEDYFMYGEDIDLSYKLQKAGYRNYYLGETTVLHYKGESTKKDAAYYKRFYGAMRIFYRKHFRGNFLLNSLVHSGVSLASFFRRNKKKNQILISHKQILVLTENFDVLKTLSENIEIPMKSVSKSVFDNGRFRETQFIFDINYMNYSQVFSVMKAHCGDNNTFRIIPPNCNFMLGSDASDEKGSVFVF